MTDKFEEEMLDFCVRFLSKRSGQLSAEHLSTLSVLFPKTPLLLHLNPLDPTSSTFQWILPMEPGLPSVEPEPVREPESVREPEATTGIVEQAPTPAKRRCPYGYDGKWASPIPVTIVKQLLKAQWRVTLDDVVKEYAKNGEKRLTHEMAIQYLAKRKGLTPEEFLTTVDPPPRESRSYWGVRGGRGPFWLADW